MSAGEGIAQAAMAFYSMRSCCARSIHVFYTGKAALMLREMQGSIRLSAPPGCTITTFVVLDGGRCGVHAVEIWPSANDRLQSSLMVAAVRVWIWQQQQQQQRLPSFICADTTQKHYPTTMPVHHNSCECEYT
eukprot:TRINITY_DN6400_c0_g1_i1.p2 TRINITY_DN6400_c0_g1~~TRINITY_DN6400_c0_g1_i1.p2  ORF type:complete len:133 (-),score=5.11 TRINITY_DN6400_c0_g1_i1:184-582(-)